MTRKVFHEMNGLHDFYDVAEWIKANPQVILENHNESMRIFFAKRNAAATPITAPEFEIKTVAFNMREPGERFIYGDMYMSWAGCKQFNPFAGFEASGIVLTGHGHATRNRAGDEVHRYEVRFLRRIWHRLVIRQMLERDMA